MYENYWPGSQLFSWLDDHGAAVCTEGTAFIKLEVPVDIDSDEKFMNFLKKEIDLDRVNRNNKIYIVYNSFDKNKTIGYFLTGNRRKNPWMGCGSANDINVIDYA